MCGTTPNHGFHRSQTEFMPSSPSYGGNRSPMQCFAGGLQNSNGSSWSLQRKPSFEHQMGAYCYGTSPPMEGPIVFTAPELTQETLLEVPRKCLCVFFFSRTNEIASRHIQFTRRSTTTRWLNSTSSWLWLSASWMWLVIEPLHWLLLSTSRSILARTPWPLHLPVC